MIKKDKVLKGKCKQCKHEFSIAADKMPYAVNMRTLTRCKDGHAYCPVCHAEVKMR